VQYQVPNEEFIAVDLDGTIIQNSIFSCVFRKLFFMDPIRTVGSIVSCILFGPNTITSRHLRRNLHLVGLDKKDATQLKFNKVLLRFLKDMKKLGKTLILATGSDQYLADLIADYTEKHFDLKFDMTLGSEPGFLCISENKLKKLREISPEFAYIGNSSQDFPLWRAKGVNMICVGTDNFRFVAQERCYKPAFLTIPPEFYFPHSINIGE
jgi:phosphoserine phosphatase